MPWYRQLHWQIIIGLILGLIFGLIASNFGWGLFVTNWVKPWGTIFINLLKMIAVPLVLASLISGVASLSDVSKLSRIGGKTIGIYICTTALAVVIGLVVVNIISPGKSFPQDQVKQSDTKQMEETLKAAGEVKERGPLQPVVDMIPENVVFSSSSNRNLLQVVFVAILVGVALIKIDPAKAAPVRSFFEGLNEVVIEVVNFIMIIAPVGVFALIASVITDLAGDDPAQAGRLLLSLTVYGVTVIVGLFLHIVLVYLMMLKFFTPIKIRDFLKALRPAQLLAFSTSSSAATLPVTKECCEKGLGVNPEISSFSLPLGATVNMDGTALYQAVAAVFIAQVYTMSLTLGDQITIILTATLASIGTAAVPSAGIIMLVIILESVKVPADGIALILGIDRILDMMRTVTNVTGDAVVTTVVAHSEGQVNLEQAADPKPIAN